MVTVCFFQLLQIYVLEEGYYFEVRIDITVNTEARVWLLLLSSLLLFPSNLPDHTQTASTGYRSFLRGMRLTELLNYQP